MARRNTIPTERVYRAINAIGLHQSEKVQLTQALYKKGYVSQLTDQERQDLLNRLKGCEGLEPAQAMQQLIGSQKQEASV